MKTALVSLMIISCSTGVSDTSESVVCDSQTSPTKCIASSAQCSLTDFSDNLQAATNACREVIIDSGVWLITVESPTRRSIDLHSSITCRKGAQIRFAGDALGRDWVGLFIGPNQNDIRITGCEFDGNDVVGTNEHSPLIQVRGPNTNTRIDHNVFWYPDVPSAKRGDCVQNIGYPENQYIENIRVDHNTFHECARVGVAFHSGTRGRIDHNSFEDTGRAADLDGEGSGFNTLEIDHNKVGIGPHTTSILALNIQADSGHRIHDNVFNKGINLYGCADCELADNVVSFMQLSTGPVLGVYKNSPNLTSHDNAFSRDTSALPGFVVHVARKGLSSPASVVFQDDTLSQATQWTALQSLGIDGLKLDRCEVQTVAESWPLWDAEGIGARTTNLEINNSIFGGSFASAMTVSGSYQGTGTVIITDSTAVSNVQKAVGLSCLSPTASSGITGPIVFQRSDWPRNMCPLLP